MSGDADDIRFDRRMSDAEALMWKLEKDPWFSSTFGVLMILERPPDFEALRAKLSHAVAVLARLRERVVAGPSMVGPPAWDPDPELELDHHLRRIALPQPESWRALLDLATLLVADPLDRTRPLWQFWCVDGLPDGRGALLTKLHHSVSDGEGALQLAEHYMDFDAGAPAPSELDLGPVVADAVAEARLHGEHRSRGTAGALAAGLRRSGGLARRAAGEIALAVADPGRLPERGDELLARVRHLSSELDAGGGAGSALWRRRSRRRRFETASTSLAALKAAADRRGAKLNDVFLAAVAEGASRYHAELEAPVDRFRATFAVSTRTRGSGANAFTPARIELPAASMPAEERLALVAAAASRAKEQVEGEGFLAMAAPLANLLPTSALTRVARQQAAAADFATSNVRTSPMPVWVGGARVTEAYALGPVAGTAFNVTMLSYCDRVDLGLHVDPVAVADPGRLARCVQEGLGVMTSGG